MAILTTIMILCFFATTIPSSLIPMLYANHHSQDPNYQTFRVSSAMVELSNYAIYILIYLVCNAEFRRELLRLLQVSLHNLNHPFIIKYLSKNLFLITVTS